MWEIRVGSGPQPHVSHRKLKFLIMVDMIVLIWLLDAILSQASFQMFFVKPQNEVKRYLPIVISNFEWLTL